MSIVAVAKKAGVSVATVSRVLNNLDSVRAETASQYVKKGMKILIAGEIDVSVYKNKQGEPATFEAGNGDNAKGLTLQIERPRLVLSSLFLRQFLALRFRELPQLALAHRARHLA